MLIEEAAHPTMSGLPAGKRPGHCFWLCWVLVYSVRLLGVGMHVHAAMALH